MGRVKRYQLMSRVRAQGESNASFWSPCFWGTRQVLELSSVAQLIAQGHWSDCTRHLPTDPMYYKT